MYGDVLHNVIINLRGRPAAQFILQYRLSVKELLQMHFNGVVRNLVFLMQACAQQLNDATAAPSRICCTSVVLVHLFRLVV